jgi:hypothetical protein
MMCYVHRYVDPVYLHKQELSPACDIYSLAVTMLQLLTGDSAVFDTVFQPPGIIARYSERLATRCASQTSDASTERVVLYSAEEQRWPRPRSGMLVQQPRSVRNMVYKWRIREHFCAGRSADSKGAIP